MNSNESSKCSSRSSSIAPLDFNITQHLNESHFIHNQINDEIEDNSLIDSLKPLMDENESRNRNSNTMKKYSLQCRVCGCDKSIFFCSDCVKNGDFTYSKLRIPERFAEKKLKYFKLKSEQNIISDKIEKQLNHYIIKDDLVFIFFLLIFNYF